MRSVKIQPIHERPSSLDTWFTASLRSSSINSTDFFVDSCKKGSKVFELYRVTKQALPVDYISIRTSFHKFLQFKGAVLALE